MKSIINELARENPALSWVGFHKVYSERLGFNPEREKLLSDWDKYKTAARRLNKQPRKL